MCQRVVASRFTWRQLLIVLAATVVSCPAHAADAGLRAAVFSAGLPGRDETFAEEIARQVATAGYVVERVDAKRLVRTLSADEFALVVLPQARSLPAAAAATIEQYLGQGGDLVALGLPAWETPLFDTERGWKSRDDYDGALAAARSENMLFDFTNADLGVWTRTADSSASPPRYEITRGERERALHVVIDRLPGWETFQSPVLTRPFPQGHTLTCFRAKGGPATRQLALEWTEQDGSRWIATVALSTEWKNYALPAEAFQAWQPPPARAAAGDSLHVENASRLVVGLAQTHTMLEGDHHEYWISQIGTARHPWGDVRLSNSFTPPHLESFSSPHPFYCITAKSDLRLFVRSDATAAPEQEIGWSPRANALVAMHPRPRGIGFRQARADRWQPLMAARDAATFEYRGTIAALVVHAEAPLRGGVWALFTPHEAEFYRDSTVMNCLADTLARMRRGIFLVEGGAEFFTVLPGEELAVGAAILNTGRAPATDISVEAALDNGSAPVLREAALALAPGERRETSTDVRLAEQGEPHLRVVLRQGGKRIDSLEHQIAVWRPHARRSFIEARDGGFWLENKPWRAHGVNYMPSSGIGLANSEHFEHWVGRGAYDPEVIERDLRRIKAMHLNAVSVFLYHQSLGARHMLDFLRRCEAHQLKVNLSLRPGTPLDFRWSEVRQMIESLGLAENDTVFAYDLAWEPCHAPQAIQRDYASRWSAWLERRYGNAEAARRAWQMAGMDDLPPESPARTAPPIAWFVQDGPWRPLMADYRAFLDDLLREQYGEARRLVKSIDPNHAVSFRMQHAGDPTYHWDGFVPYDFVGLADAVDIWAPEAYGRIGDWERVKPGRFTASYARLCDSAKPMMWAEMGFSVWDAQVNAPGREKQEFQARYYRDFYRMMNESGVDGVFFWWYPGGYRFNERSDYGLIEPDGTDRPVTPLVRREGAKFLAGPKANVQPDYWITVDRDCDSRGLFAIYERAEREYWQAIAAGKTPGLRWQNSPGRTPSAD